MKINPIRRDLHFPVSASRLRDWHRDGLHTSHFFNALSILFPEGERFFIHSVRYYRDRITDPQLQKDVAAFIGQEAMHSREHADYNRRLADVGLPAVALERELTRVLTQVKRLPAPMQLSATIAAEHLTAILADVLLREPRILQGADPVFADLWRWHALEETEHKAVAFDVYQRVMGRGLRAWLLRAFGLLGASTVFWVATVRFHFILVRADGGLADWRGWWRLFRFHWLTPGGLRRVVPAWFDYFRPGFHPWQHDNRRFLKRMDALESRYALAPAA